MGDNSDISESERDEFRQAMDNFQSFSDEKVSLSTSNKRKESINNENQTLSKNVSAQDIISHKKSGLKAKTWRDFKLGKIYIEDQIDLHGMHAEQARIAVIDFIDRSIKTKKRCLLIIHGKGIQQQSEFPVLKNAIKNLLLDVRGILAIHSAQNKHGGTGALYVLLHKNIKG